MKGVIGLISGSGKANRPVAPHEPELGAQNENRFGS
jgi:hypothetical protein